MNTPKTRTSIIVVVLTLVIAGVAWAFFRDGAPTTGSATTAEGSNIVWTGTNVSATMGTGPGTCTATFDNSGTEAVLDLTFDGAAPGSECVYQGQVENVGNVDVTTLGSTVGADDPALSASATCGTTLAPASPMTLDFTVTVTDSAESGTTYDLSGDGILVTTSDQFTTEDCL